MRSFRRFTSGESQAAAARFPDFVLAMASPLKKSLRAAERKRADVARARRRWIREQGFLDPAHLVFIDETAVTTNMLRLNGWNPRGERLVSDAPMGHWETVTFIAGLRQTGVVAPMLIKGAMNGEAFLAYIEQCLVPTLKRRDIAVTLLGARVGEQLGLEHGIGHFLGQRPAQAGSLEASDRRPNCRCSHSNSTGNLTDRYATNELQPKNFAHLAHDRSLCWHPVSPLEQPKERT